MTGTNQRIIHGRAGSFISASLLRRSFRKDFNFAAKPDIFLLRDGCELIGKAIVTICRIVRDVGSTRVEEIRERNSAIRETHEEKD